MCPERDPKVGYAVAWPIGTGPDARHELPKCVPRGIPKSGMPSLGRLGPGRMLATSFQNVSREGSQSRVCRRLADWDRAGCSPRASKMCPERDPKVGYAVAWPIGTGPDARHELPKCVPRGIPKSGMPSLGRLGPG